jgi:hypothetical protein
MHHRPFSISEYMLLLLYHVHWKVTLGTKRSQIRSIPKFIENFMHSCLVQTSRHIVFIIKLPAILTGKMPKERRCMRRVNISSFDMLRKPPIQGWKETITRAPITILCFLIVIKLCN